MSHHHHDKVYDHEVEHKVEHHHHHDHHHDHHHHHGFDPAMGKRFVLAIIINLIYVVSEFYLGFRYDSVGLLADAGHNLSDVGGLLISLSAFFLLKKPAGSTFTYGFKKATVLAALVNSLMLLGAVAVIIYECIDKFLHGSHASGSAIMLTAGIGILVNGFTVFLLSRGKEHDLNVKSAYLHMLADTLVSCGVVLSGGLIMLSGFTWLDPVIGLVIAGIILYSSWGVFAESVILTLDGVPHNIDLPQLQQELAAIENVADIHHLHIWAVSTIETALTAHVKLYDITLLENTKSELKTFLQQHNIPHSALEFESPDHCCSSHC